MFSTALPGPADTLTPDDPAYPPALREIADPPATLYVRGRLDGRDRIAVAVVGARRASAYGLSVAEWLGRELARRRITVVSGMARGIDAAAHRGALAGGGRTIAVLGCGPDRVYPAEHEELMRAILASGAVLTEFPPGTPPMPYQFLQRNRIISGLSLGVVVVEGRGRSGALATVDHALAQGREVFAVPGGIFAETSHLPNHLIQEGAFPVTSVEDVLGALRLPLHGFEAADAVPALSGAEAVLYAQLTDDPQHIDTLAQRSGITAGEAGRALLALELAGWVRTFAGQRYARVQ